MMQGKTKTLERSQLKDRHGRHTISGIYLLAKSGIEKDLAKSKKETCTTISFYDFRRVMMLYFYYGLTDAINGRAFKFYKYFGEVRVVKTLLKLYKPKSNVIRVVDGKRVVVENDMTEAIKKRNGYWYFFNWEVAKRWRTHEFTLNRRWIKRMMDKIETGFDYLDYTYIGITDGYVRKIR